MCSTWISKTGCGGSVKLPDVTTCLLSVELIFLRLVPHPVLWSMAHLGSVSAACPNHGSCWRTASDFARGRGGTFLPFFPLLSQTACSVWLASLPACGRGLRSSHSVGTPFLLALPHNMRQACCTLLVFFREILWFSQTQDDQKALGYRGWLSWRSKTVFLSDLTDSPANSDGGSAMDVIMGPRLVTQLPHLFLEKIQWKWKRKKRSETSKRQRQTSL